MNTLLLDLENWDLAVDTAGNIALATGRYAIAQDVASAVRSWLGTVWYDLNQGVPYLLRDSPDAQILGKNQSPEFMRSAFVTAGLTVPEVAAIKCFLTGPDPATRELGGQLQIFDTLGNLVGVAQTDVFQGGAPWYVSGVSS